MRVDFNSFHVKGLLLGLTDVDDPIPRSSNGLSEEISFKILKQVVEVEQATMWKFLWWSGIIAVHVMVGQSIDDHSKLFSSTSSSSLCLLFPSWFAG
ncbi:uncharacterized protein LOC113316952 isoform X4 [Papaver somniferum]|uniref:uncharacterized protein LOC113316952 isoform X4 n=1 Tax=Papaver somniferum TaxID=3469 RepID=UPI000E6F61AE|nr:uncharacterized protein LOC113316952 isoform X4 [Papaver somniferum]